MKVEAPVETYNFKNIGVVLSADNLKDVILSKTNRGAPTVVHKNFRISRIREFYIKKVNVCRDKIEEKLVAIGTGFPKLDGMHPFYEDLCNVLYDRDHYKIALGHCNAIKRMINGIAKDYVRLIKYADSMYKCKMLKRAAFGRMCSSIKKLQNPLEYLEQVRQRMSRLPCIDPYAKTLILAGYPNVGKSSLVNRISQANVEVQPYAFTTKALYVGHFDHDFSRWQVIDTPGLLDRPLDERNVIEMTAITALAHLPAAVLYVFDLSEACGYSLSDQIQMFQSIEPLFKNKVVLKVVNKVDLRQINDLESSEVELLTNLAPAAPLMECSTLTGNGVDDIKIHACELLTKSRSLTKIDKSTGPLGVFVAHPSESKILPEPNFPPSLLDSTDKPPLILEKTLEDRYGGPGNYAPDERSRYLFQDPCWKYDAAPQIINGHNVSDFCSTDVINAVNKFAIDAASGDQRMLCKPTNECFALQAKVARMHLAIKKTKAINKHRRGNLAKRVERSKHTVPQIMQACAPDAVRSKAPLPKRRNRLPALPKNERSGPRTSALEHNLAVQAVNADVDISVDQKMILDKGIALNKSYLLSVPDPHQRRIAEHYRRTAMRKLNKQGRRGEGDHHIPDWKPKHLYKGKFGLKERLKKR